MPAENEIAIAGAGVAGLASAVALARSGLRATVFERASELRDGGGALILWCNALKALDALGLREALLATPSAQPIDASEYRTARGEHLTSVPLAELGERHGAESIVVARRDLLDTLYRAARDVADVRFGCAVDVISQDNHNVVLQRADATPQTFRALLGADGLRSSLRARVGLDASLRDLNQDLWVATTDLRPSSIEPGITVATVGDGARFWYAALGDGRTFWYATLRTDTGSPAATTLSEVSQRLSTWHAPIPALVRATREADALRTAIRDRRPCLPWHSGRVVLVGDAAHAMTPDLGQGACQAIESALVLGRCMGESAVPEAYARYEQRRFARTSDVNRMSFIAATTSTVATPALCAIRDLGMRFGLRATAMSQLDWLFRGVDG